MSRQTIPAEILCEIFLLLCKEPIALHVLENGKVFDYFPWAAGQVCQHWRGVFVSYPRLWTSLSLKYTYVDTYVDSGSAHPDSERFVEMERRTTIYLERSRQLPLTISISIKSSSRTKRVAFFPLNTWNLLLSCSNRWEKAVLNIGNAPDVVDGLFGCRNKISILESLNLAISGFIHESTARDYAFAMAPRLTNLQLKHHGVNPIIWVFPWSQLTKLSIEISWSHPDIDTQVAIALSKLQNLEELHYIYDGGFRPRLSPRIRLPSLRFLDLSSPYLFEWFEAPLLEHIWFRSHTSMIYVLADDDWKMKISLFIKQSCLIRRLTIQRYNHLGKFLMEGLGAGIEELCIRDTDQEGRSQLIQRIGNSEDGICLPNLQELQTICCSREAISDKFMEAISLLVETRGKGSRSAVAPSLERVVLELKWGKNCDCRGRRCRNVTDTSFTRKLDKILGAMRNRFSAADISVSRSRSQICSTITLCLRD